MSEQGSNIWKFDYFLEESLNVKAAILITALDPDQMLGDFHYPLTPHAIRCSRVGQAVIPMRVQSRQKNSSLLCQTVGSSVDTTSS